MCQTIIKTIVLINLQKFYKFNLKQVNVLDTSMHLNSFTSSLVYKFFPFMIIVHSTQSKIKIHLIRQRLVSSTTVKFDTIIYE